LCDEENVKTVLARVDKWSNAVRERHWGSMDSVGQRSSVNSVMGDTVMSERDNRGVDSVNTVR